MTNILDFTARLANGQDADLNTYRGKVLLIVNTASYCGFTPQYAGLESLQNKYCDQGFFVLAFPCNQFGNQEPGTESEIQSFCDLHYQTTFPLFAKIEVNGAGSHPLFNHLKLRAPGLLGSKRIKWNFTKFLINRQGEVVKRFAPTTKPDSISRDIETLLEPG